MSGTGLTKEILEELTKTKSLKEIAEMYNCSYQNVRWLCKRYNVSYIKIDRKNIKLPTIYEYDDTYFNVIDTEHKAYWLGFIMADGCIVQKSKNKPSLSLVINLMGSDDYHLEKFNKDLNGNLPVRHFKQKPVTINAANSIVHLDERDCCKIEVNSKWLCLDLIKHGVDKRKTLNEQIPLIENIDLERHFIRGFFDGDGCFSAVKPKNRNREYAKIFIASGEIIIDFIINRIYQSTGVLMSKDTYGKLYRCNCQNEDGCLKIIKYMYEDATVYLDRKKELIDSYMQRYSLNI